MPAAAIPASLAGLGYVTADWTRSIVGVYRIVVDPHPDFGGSVAMVNAAGEPFPLWRELATQIEEPVALGLQVGDPLPV